MPGITGRISPTKPSSTQSQPAAAGPAATTVLQGVTLPPSAVAMLNTPDGLVQPGTPATGGEATPVLTVQTEPQAPPTVSTPLPLGLQPPQQQQQPPPPPQAPAPQAAAPAQATTPQPSPGLASSPEKIVLGQPPSAAPTAVLTQDSLQMFLPQVTKAARAGEGAYVERGPRAGTRCG